MHIHNNNEGGIVTIQESWVCTSIIAVILGANLATDCETSEVEEDVLFQTAGVCLPIK